MADKAITPEDQRLLIEVGDRIATITLNRPEARNAMTKRMRNDLCAALRASDADDGVDAIILTGADPVFTGGVDLREVAADGVSETPDGNKRQAEDPAQACRDTAKPLICAVNGTCVTGGLEIALSCDFIVASDQARFADTHAKIGVIAAWGMTALLPRAVGKRMAKEMTATARFVSPKKPFASDWSTTSFPTTSCYPMLENSPPRSWPPPPQPPRPPCGSMTTPTA